MWLAVYRLAVESTDTPHLPVEDRLSCHMFVNDEILEMILMAHDTMSIIHRLYILQSADFWRARLPRCIAKSTIFGNGGCGPSAWLSVGKTENYRPFV